MHKLADLIEQHRETLATIETWDNGLLPLFADRLLISSLTDSV
jgi:acyl-CoA reductase-like NAD-dependent aldehyde dehydrogenase